MKPLIAAALACAAWTAHAATDLAWQHSRYTVQLTSDADLDVSAVLTEEVINPIATDYRIRLTFGGFEPFEVVPTFTLTFTHLGPFTWGDWRYFTMERNPRYGPTVTSPRGPIYSLGWEEAFKPQSNPITVWDIEGMPLSGGPTYTAVLTEIRPPVPEPGAYALALTGLGVLALAKRRR